MRRIVGVASATLTLLVLALGVAVLFFVHRYDAAGPSTSETVVIIPRGAGLSEIAARLEAEGVIEDQLIFEVGTRVDGLAPQLKAGEFRFEAGVSMREAAEHLVSGRTVKHRLTIPEGLTSAEIVEKVESFDVLVGEIGTVPDEGELLPDTYFVTRGDSRSNVLARMKRAMDKTLARLWEGRDSELPFESPRDALIMASIVEKETAVPQERNLVAGVFVNRLRRGMRLQSDPTVVYGLTEGKGPLGRTLTRNDLDEPTEYNTYQIEGLPPGPIANPGRSSIEAVLDPAETDYLYFVADGSGGHAFAKTLDGHNRNVAEWRRIQRAQNSE